MADHPEYHCDRVQYQVERRVQWSKDDHQNCPERCLLFGCSILFARFILGIGYKLEYKLEVDLRYIDFQLENNGTVFFGDGV